ncbi:MAG: ABC transporter permease [Defluviitaleaceae bacterium]|nr:ABC transporter permease [Defluviitaleaceae bacterium]
MYLLEHAMLNLGKNKGRNMLLLGITFAIITAIVVALSIFNATNLVIEETRTSLQSAVRIVPQMQTLGETGGTGGGQMITGQAAQNQATFTAEQFSDFANSDFVLGWDLQDTPRGTDAVFYLVSPLLLSDFEAELREKGLPENYAVRTDEAAFASIVAPVESLQSLAITFLAVVVVLGGVIMALLSVIAIRERKYEIGVLRAMGLKKRKVAFVIWAENVIITGFCFVLGMAAGNFLSQPISDNILAGQILSNADGESTATTLAERLASESADALSTENFSENLQIDILINATTALQILAISLLLASLVGIISVSQITKSEPIKILMERT